MFAKFRQRQNSGFVQTRGRHADGMFDAFRVGERDDAGAEWHDSSIGEEKGNKKVFTYAISALAIS